MTPPRPTTAFKGAILSVGMRWTDRLVGLISMLVLARLLTPADFGLVAMAMVVVGLLDVLLDLGVSAALIQNESSDKLDFDTAWTLRLAQSSIAAVLIVVGAPWAADYYHDPRIVDIMRVIAISVFVGGFENIGIVSFQKNMEFGRDFQFFLSKKLFGTVFTIAAALAFRSYWALVLGSLVSRLAGVGLSYRMHDFRPHLSLARLSRIWSFSQWNLLKSTAAYMSARVDRFVLGRRVDASVVGAYSMADEIASMPTTELLAPLGRVMFPAFVRAKGDPPELCRVVLLAFSVQAMVGIPAGVGVALVANEAVPILLGRHWLAAIPFMQILGLVGVATALIHSSYYMLMTLGRMRTLAIFQCCQFLALVVLLFGVFPHSGGQGAAMSRLAVAAGGLVVMQVLTRSAVPGFGVTSMFKAAWRPLVAAMVMAAAVLAVAGLLSSASLIVLLSAKVAAGVIGYALAIVLLWRAAGCPDGAEAYFVEKLRLTSLLGMRGSR